MSSQNSRTDEEINRVWGPLELIERRFALAPQTGPLLLLAVAMDLAATIGAARSAEWGPPNGY